jgi:hypothetical protein
MITGAEWHINNESYLTNYQLIHKNLNFSSLAIINYLS